MSIRILIFFAALFTAVASYADHAVTLLLSDQKPASREFSDAFQKSLKRIAPALAIKEVTTLSDAQDGSQKVIVAVGSAAFQSGMKNSKKSPVVAALLPHLSYERLVSQANDVGTTAVFLDQSEDRQMSLLSMLPGSPSMIGTMRSASTGISFSRLRTAAQKKGVKLQEELVSSERELAMAIQNLTAKTEVILATPDPDVYNPQTIQSILLTAYRARIPLVGFSPAYTRAGALISLHSSVGQLAEQTAEVVKVIGAGGAVPGAQSPRLFEISINRQVARSLGFDLPTEAAFADGLRLHEMKERAQ